MWTLISLPLQMAKRLRRAQPDSVANHVKARQSLIERSITWLATESGWARRKRSGICSGKLCRVFIIFEQCCPCGCNTSRALPMNLLTTGSTSTSCRCWQVLAWYSRRVLSRRMVTQTPSPTHVICRTRLSWRGCTSTELWQMSKITLSDTQQCNTVSRCHVLISGHFHFSSAFECALHIPYCNDHGISFHSFISRML